MDPVIPSPNRESQIKTHSLPLSSPLSPHVPRHVLIVSGLISGVVSSGLFNFYDRALYLSVVHHRPFLSPMNFDHPFRGFYQSMVHRTLSGGLYFPLFDVFQQHFTERQHRGEISLSPFALHFLSGNLAGGLLGIFLNQLTAIKYASWDTNLGFSSTAKAMWRDGGIRPFFKGIVPTVVRDTVFGGAFAISKFMVTEALPQGKQSEFCGALIGGAVGTALSSPFNYIRNVKYSWKNTEAPPGSFRIVKSLWTECRAAEDSWGLFRERLRVGWGTLRVALGMAVGLIVYEYCRDTQMNRKHKTLRETDNALKIHINKHPHSPSPSPSHNKE